MVVTARRKDNSTIVAAARDSPEITAIDYNSPITSNVRHEIVSPKSSKALSLFFAGNFKNEELNLTDKHGPEDHLVAFHEVILENLFVGETKYNSRKNATTSLLRISKLTSSDLE